MKKKFHVLTLFVILTLFLAACGGAEDQEGTPPGAGPGVDVTEPAMDGTLGADGTPGVVPDTQGTPTGGLSGGAETVQPTDTRQPTATSGAAGGAAGGAGTATVQPTTAGTQTGGLATPGVPVTGMANLLRAEELLGYSVEVLGAGGDVTGTGTPAAGGASATQQATGTAAAGGTGGATPDGTAQTTQMPTDTAGADGNDTSDLETSNFIRLSELLDFSVQSSQVDTGDGAGTGTPAADGGSATQQATGTPAAGGGSATQQATGTAGAGGTGGATPDGTAQATQMPAGTAGADSGTSNVQGEEIGTVEDLILPITFGATGSPASRNEYVWVVVAVDESFLGLGPDQLIPVPLVGTRVDTERQVILLNVDASIIEQAPSFSSNQWPSLSTGWDTEFLGFWMDNMSPGNSGSAGQPTRQPTMGGDSQATPMATGTSTGGSSGSGALVQQGTPSPDAGTNGGSAQQTGTPDNGDTATGQGVVLGRVTDVILLLNAAGNSASGTPSQNSVTVVQYLVVRVDEELDRTDESDLVAIPWDRVQFFQPDRQVVIVDVSEAEMQDAPGFPSGEWPSMTSNNWDQQWQQFWKTSKP